MPESSDPRPHLTIKGHSESADYTGTGRGTPKIFARDRSAHAKFLQEQIATIEAEFEKTAEKRKADDLSSEFGLVLNVVSAPDYPLEFTRLEHAPTKHKDGITLLNVRQEQTPEGQMTTCAAVLVPHGRLDVLAKKISDYADPAKDTKPKDPDKPRQPKNNPLVANIASIGVAALEALWTGSEPLDGNEKEVRSWELWIRRGEEGKWEQQFREKFADAGIEYNESPPNWLLLPDHVVVIVRATRAQLESSLDILNCLAEVKRPRPCSLGLHELSGPEQSEWVDEALSRMQPPVNQHRLSACWTRV